MVSSKTTKRHLNGSSGLLTKAMFNSGLAGAYTPVVRANDETWGFVGYELTELPESTMMGHCGCGRGIEFWTYNISDYNMWQRAGEMD